MYSCNSDAVVLARSGPDDWYAAYTKHQHEKRVADSFKNKGFEVFFPVYVAAHRWKDRTQMVTLPLFPATFFCAPISKRKLEILRTPGVFGLVGNAGRATSIPDGDLDMVRRVTADRTRSRASSIPEMWRQGSRMCWAASGCRGDFGQGEESISRRRFRRVITEGSRS